MHFNHLYLINYLEKRMKNKMKGLDFGCGKGGLVSAARGQNLDVYGADIFYKNGETREMVIRSGLYGDVIREIRDGKIDFPANSFHFVVANQVFEHVENLDQSLAELARVMTPDGTILTLFPVKETLWEGHFGLPFIHNMNKMGQSRILFAKIWFHLGLGYHRKNRSASEWAKYVTDWVDSYTTYRSLKEIYQVFEQQGFLITLADEAYLKSRFLDKIASKYKLISKLLNSQVSIWFLRKLYLVRGGVVIEGKLMKARD